MSTLTIRNLGESIKSRLRVRAAAHGRSMEEEARQILRAAVSGRSPSPEGLGTRIHRRFAALGGVDLELPARDPARVPPGFED
jgi:plasmid stability protein